MITFSSVFLNFLSISIKVYMKYLKDFGYMSIIETITDVDNAFLSRRELTCNFAGLGGKLKKLEAVDMINKEFNLDGKVIIPIILKTQVGKSTVTGTFFVYDDEGLAKKHVNPTIFSRLEKTQAKLAEAEAAAKEAEAAAKEAEAPAEEVKAPAEEVKEEKAE
jgi:ribosomal protein S24E